ncbi:hypothetical protein [Orenia marismortui]|uniref:Uncharacterized protein n=1 Tax=Orenia marismortui TaxID=46469 RepID=A0A4R8GLN4_9FIRM|nr:hypothetical protein [Orenia marismortui]TDX46592.1 hypothetical protein C7959_1397 [Orenia marismortui]
MSDKIIVVSISAVLGPAFLSWLNWYLKQKNNKDPASKVARLEDHRIFSQIDTLLSEVKFNIAIKNLGRQELAKTILYKKFEIWQEELLELAKKIDNNDYENLYKLQMCHFNKAHSRFNSFYRLDDYLAEDQECLEIAIRKFNGFNKIRIEYMSQTIDSLSTSEFLTENKARSAAIFVVYAALFVDIINDAEKTFSVLNGELSGKKFKGYTL